MKDIFDKALEVAKTFDVSTSENSLVLYSVSFLPTKENKIKAFEYLENNPTAIILDKTPCGVEMINMGLENGRTDLSAEEVAYLWKVASRRLIDEASGNIMAFVDNADERSVFRSMELPSILANEKITTINNEDKFVFAKTKFLQNN